jgi:hypothetical protein
MTLTRCWWVETSCGFSNRLSACERSQVCGGGSAVRERQRRFLGRRRRVLGWRRRFFSAR